MAGFLQLTEQANPLAQTFRVTEPGGSFITGVGLFFSSAPTASDLQIPIAVELRPVGEGGNPSSKRFYPGSRVTVAASTVRAAKNTSFGSATEVKFTFRSPVYIPSNTEAAIVVSTTAPAGQYKVWIGQQGEFKNGSTTVKITRDLNSGSLFTSSNGTTWTADQYSDLAFKVYRAKFQDRATKAYLVADAPPMKRLTESTRTKNIIKYPSAPLRFTAGSPLVRVIHPNHGFQNGDQVKLSTDSDGFDSASTVNGISGANLLGTKTIDSADPFGYTFNCGSNADSSIRAGGNSLMASEQYIINDVKLQLSKSIPPYSSIYAHANLTTSKSFAGSETAYQTTSNISLPLRSGTKGIVTLKDPHVIASIEQENHVSKLNGNPSTVVEIGLDTTSAYSAPYFDVESAALITRSNLIDYQDSAGAGLSTRNTIRTIDFAPETNANGGTNASKHLTIVYKLEDTATSIRVLVDAIKPDTADFDVWYRTSRTTTGTSIKEKTWTKFSRSPNVRSTYSNYDLIGTTYSFREFEFNVFDITDFDEYQIKITMYSRRSSMIPMFKNLRTIATV